ncbi:MAG TPA: hypothetical protein VMU41_11260 [Candidatus Binataceae bacterium]|nr:hypothetical protein [Candidatus Binataceae bacterium]
MGLFLLVWPGMAAGFVALFTSTALGWRLFFFVPLAGEIVLYCGLASRGGFAEYLIWIPMASVVSIALFGWQATILGELTWLAVRWSELPKKVPSQYQLPVGTVSGAAFAMLYYFASVWLLSRTTDLSEILNWERVWLAAYAAGGAVGGLLVAHYGVKEFGDGPRDAKPPVGTLLGRGAAKAGSS